MFEVFWMIFAFVYGLILGSFVNVCIYRIPENISLWTPPSTCPGCGYKLKWYDNIPVLSYIFLGAKCRSCKMKIAIQYPIVEILTGFIVALFYFKFGLSFDMIFLSAIIVVLITIAVIDYKTMIIPNGLVIALVIIGLFYIIASFIFPESFVISITWFESLIGFFAASLPLFIIAVISKGGMGGGDIKLMAAVGIFLGWKYVLVAMIAGSLIGAIISLTLIALKIKKRKDMIPFGPFLCLGILISAAIGPEIVNWYTGLFTIIP